MTGQQLSNGAVAPDFSLKGVDGNVYTLASFDSKSILIVIFSCNHCPYVHAYENRIIKLQELFAQRGVQFLAINSNDDRTHPEDSFERMVNRSKIIKYNFPYLRDDTQDTAKDYGATHTPEVFVFNQNRKLAYYGKIDDNWKQPDQVVVHYLKNAIEEILQGKNVQVPETFAIGCTIKWK